MAQFTTLGTRTHVRAADGTFLGVYDDAATASMVAAAYAGGAR